MLPLQQRIFTVDDSNFEQTALEVFRFQFAGIEVYRLFCQSLGRTPDTVNSFREIPFLPIEFFKSHKIIQPGMEAKAVFDSSGTTGAIPSRHYVADTDLYEKSFLKAFKQFYGSPSDYAILGLLPSYLERKGSSLVYMVNKLIQLSGQEESGFFLNEFENLRKTLIKLRDSGQKTILLGVTFGLLDFADSFEIEFPELIVMETGGMKGRREEMTRFEVHSRLKKALGVLNVHSEYGMTELLSQGYSKGDGLFECPAWMKILSRDIYDPLNFGEADSVGGVNIIDLANINSCSFIATGDIARTNSNGTFEILGRMDNAEIRGCNLMVL